MGGTVRVIILNLFVSKNRIFPNIFFFWGGGGVGYEENSNCFFLVCLILFLVISRCSLLGPRLFISRKTWVSGTILPVNT